MFLFFKILVKKWYNFFFFNIYNSYPLPKGKQGYFFSFGILLFFFLLIEILTGIFLSMYYVPHTDKAFLSIDHLMHDVTCGWLVRSIHEQSTHFFFFILFILLFKGIYYKRYSSIKSIYTWSLGIILFILLLFSAFIGRILPWSMYSYYSAIIITNLFNVFSSDAVYILWGGFSMNSAYLNRFFCLHYLLPFFCFLVFIIYFFLCFSKVPNKNRSFSESALRFKRYCIIKEITILCVFLLVFVVFIYLNFFENVLNYLQANVLFTHKPLILDWYLLPFFTIIRSFIRWDFGILYILFTFIICYSLPRLDIQIKRYTYIHSSLHKKTFWFFLFNFIFLGYLGTQSGIGIYSELTLFCTWVHFFYLMFVMPCCFIFDTFIVGVFKRVVPRPLSRLERYWRDLLRLDEYDDFRWGLFTLAFEKTALDILKILKTFKKDRFIRAFYNAHKTEPAVVRNYWVKNFLNTGPKSRNGPTPRILRKKIKKKPLHTFFKLLKKKKINNETFYK